MKIRLSNKNIGWQKNFVTCHFLLVMKKFRHLSFFIGDETFLSPIHSVTELRWQMLFRHNMYSVTKWGHIVMKGFVTIVHFDCSILIFFYFLNFSLTNFWQSLCLRKVSVVCFTSIKLLTNSISQEAKSKNPNFLSWLVARVIFSRKKNNLHPWCLNLNFAHPTILFLFDFTIFWYC